MIENSHKSLFRNFNHFHLTPTRMKLVLQRVGRYLDPQFHGNMNMMNPACTRHKICKLGKPFFEILCWKKCSQALHDWNFCAFSVGYQAVKFWKSHDLPKRSHGKMSNEAKKKRLMNVEFMRKNVNLACIFHWLIVCFNWELGKVNAMRWNQIRLLWKR